jgi:AIG2-like family
MIYFAYGSNMDPEQMRRRCPGHKVLGRAFLPDYALCFPRRSPVRKCATAGITRADGEGVWGVLYELDAFDQTRLHVAEGYVPGGPAGLNRHTVEFVEVRGGPEGARLTAYTYLARPDKSGALPSEDYLDHLLRGAEHHRLPQDYVEKLWSIRVIPTSDDD